MNVDLLRRTADLIELEDRFDLSYWAAAGDTHEPVHPARLLDDCKTVGCIAGWVCAASGVAVAVHDSWCGWCGLEYQVAAAAQEALGLDNGSAERLFSANGGSVWAEQADAIGWNRDEGTWSDITAVQAAKVLRQIADGEVEL